LYVRIAVINQVGGFAARFGTQLVIKCIRGINQMDYLNTLKGQVIRD